MPESMSTRGKAPATQRAPARDAGRGSGRAPALSVRYWKKMRINKVYPVVVSWSGAGRDGGEPVSVRVVMAGAQVVPNELVMDPNEPRATATFYVTPLANGGLRGEKVEVLHQGQKIQEIRIPCNVTSQRGTLVWLFLALFIPWLMLHFFMYSPIGYKPPLNPDGTEKTVTRPWKEKVKLESPEPKNPTKMKVETLDVEDAAERVITQRVKDNTPDLKDPLKDVGVDIYDDVQRFPGEAYAHLFKNYHNLDQPLALYAFLALLFVAFLSFLLRLEGRKRVTGKPLPLGAEGEY
jgi:hypothetical protein